MKTLLPILLIALLLPTFYSCKKSGASLFTPTSSGLPYELVVVAEDDIWKSDAGKELRKVLKSPIPGLPQPESFFYVMHVIPANYDNVMKLLRNVVIMKIGDEFSAPKIKYSIDVHAHPQLIMTIQAPDAQSFIDCVRNSKETILSMFDNAELNRYVANFKEKHNATVSQAADSLFNLVYWAPLDMKRFKYGKDFFWASDDAVSGIRNVVIYSLPYVSSKQFTKEAYIAIRDSVMRANVPGSHENSYMATEDFTVEMKNINVGGQFASEARGLWKMKGDFMGGPFVSHSMVDTLNNRIVTAEIFIYAPEKTKRRPLKEMESTLFSMRFLNNKLFDEKNK